MFNTPTDHDPNDLIDPADPWAFTLDPVDPHGVLGDSSTGTFGGRDDRAGAAHGDPWTASVGDLPALRDMERTEPIDWPPTPPAGLPAHAADPVRVEIPAVLRKPDTRVNAAIVAAVFFAPIGVAALASALTAEAAWKRGDVGEAARHAQRVGPRVEAALRVGTLVWIVAIAVILVVLFA